MIECLTLDQVDDLGTDAGKRPSLFGHDHPVRPGDRGKDGGLVERPDRAQVDDLGVDPLLGQRLGGVERWNHRLGVADDRHVAAGRLMSATPIGVT